MIVSNQAGSKKYISYDPPAAKSVNDIVDHSDEISSKQRPSILTDELILALPPGLKDGHSYYLALKREEGNLILAASGMTVMPADSQEAIELLSIISP